MRINLLLFFQKRHPIKGSMELYQIIGRCLEEEKKYVSTMYIIEYILKKYVFRYIQINYSFPQQYADSSLVAETTCPQTENKQSSAIQLSIDAINNDIAKLGVELGRIQQKQESLMMDDRSVIDSQLKFESKKLQVSTDLDGYE